ncbi:hypothetical protein [Roseiconus lacunae]|uniref:Secreted protein n=1 Tax=Roseiconus lacunae TaxID=2605694 RepID=A0ABT7PRS5_9BACT|nr:hypothetical protein [Roseiconus lacunae]MCD0462631.1 hypothetical protein [Roseiconus lacunae]MDM4019176.1 hypothetical protein [Roseiconus lacunae]WRQ49030.1 hypothetical protein U8335_18935 [Stieleria sp. HD01]
MKKHYLLSSLLLTIFAVGCSSSQPEAIEQTMTPEEIAAQDAEYEAEMEAAENDTLGEG